MEARQYEQGMREKTKEEKQKESGEIESLEKLSQRGGVRREAE